MRSTVFALSLALAVAACSPESADDSVGETTETAAPMTESPPPLPSPQTATPAPIPPAKDADGCWLQQLPGHWEGEGLGKRYVPGATVKVCDMRPIPPAPTAEPRSAPLPAVPTAR